MVEASLWSKQALWSKKPWVEPKPCHAGTARRDAEFVTSGGRVVGVTVLGDSVRMAQKRAYEIAQAIRFDGMQYRRDIGWRAIARRPP